MTVNKAKFVEVDENHAGQRIDNFLLAHFTKVPKSRIYRALRSGEVRVNKGRVKPIYRVKLGDMVRLPPISTEQNINSQASVPKNLIGQLEDQIIFENEHLLVINKPAGIAVHSGTGERWGVIEAFRASREHQPFLELAHRIDKDTSGCLVLAKTRRALLDVQDALHAKESRKEYIFLVKGDWKIKKHTVEHALEKQANNSIGSKMAGSESGKDAITIFTTKERFKKHSLMSASILTGRTHQIRVHAQLEGHPIAGDKRYGDFEYNRELQKLGLQRMFLHADYLKLCLSALSQTLEFRAPLPEELKKLCKRLRKGE
ncbi:MAG: RluA family pseudouridine synthase [Gammaproteobacteria bacterium]|nr:RluA family pseudouridine synthase [Gammaproteobacteria bacterium]